MKSSFTRFNLIVGSVALALLALCFLQAQVRAQGMTEQILVSPPVGLASGQSLRFSLFIPDGTPVRAQVKLHDERGAIIAQSNKAVIPLGQFRSFDFNRSDISLAGEGTGRIQLRASIRTVRLTFSEAVDPVVALMEIVEVKDGTSNTVFVGEAFPSQTGGSGNDVLNSGFGNDMLMGFAPGQTLRVSLFNPPSSGSEAQRKPVGGRVKLFDSRGNLIAQSPDLVIPPGEFRPIEFNRYALPLPGEPGTGRLQVRVRLEVATADPFSFTTDPKATGQLAASYELIDNTGKTTASWNNLKQSTLARIDYDGPY